MSVDPSGKFLATLTEAFGRVRLKGGVVARTSQVAIALVFLWISIAWKWNDNPWNDGGLFALGFMASAVFLLWNRTIQQFAERNPAQAMLEGAEFVKYARFESQAKGGRTGDPVIIADPSAPRIVAPDDGQSDAQ